MKRDADKAGRGRILVAEDEDLLRWSVKQYLEERGFLVVGARDGVEARAELARQTFDVVIADLKLQGVDGLSLAAFVQKSSPESQVIIITGVGSKESVIEALRRGVFDYIEKPFQLELLFLRTEKAMEKIAMARELVRLGRTDGLTGLCNQRYFYEVLEKELARARRQEHPLSLILLDVDNFKEYNDRNGHLAGDQALDAVAQCLKDACRRDTDTPFRYGGDEFIIILPEADLGTAQGVSGRVRDLLAARGPQEITLSIGLAQLEKDQDPKAFVHNADEAMYLAKQLGGDRSIVFSHRS